ncbi:hypothetical protein AAY473_001017 [Plecturocebus cupreus]
MELEPIILSKLMQEEKTKYYTFLLVKNKCIIYVPIKLNTDIRTGPGMVAHACNPSTLGGQASFTGSSAQKIREKYEVWRIKNRIKRTYIALNIKGRISSVPKRIQLKAKAVQWLCITDNTLTVKREASATLFPDRIPWSSCSEEEEEEEERGYFKWELDTLFALNVLRLLLNSNAGGETGTSCKRTAPRVARPQIKRDWKPC